MAEKNTTSTNEAVQTTQVGVVESDTRDKTRKVVIRWSVKHPKYGKYMRRRTVLHVHDEANESRNGDTVEIIQCRPISKTKQWKLLRVVRKGTSVEAIQA
jgi:small subunit ribosomal protein S17